MAYFINTVVGSEETHTILQPIQPFSEASLETDLPLNKVANFTALTKSMVRYNNSERTLLVSKEH